MYSVLIELVSLGESLLAQVDDASSFIFYTFSDSVPYIGGYSLMGLLLPSVIVLYVTVELISWASDMFT